MNNHRVPRRSSVRCSILDQPRFRSTGGQLPYPGTELIFREQRLGDEWMIDAQADVPSAKWLRAQLAFKDSMVHGILQFTPSIAFRYVLHRCESRDIRCRESF